MTTILETDPPLNLSQRRRGIEILLEQAIRANEQFASVIPKIESLADDAQTLKSNIMGLLSNLEEVFDAENSKNEADLYAKVKKVSSNEMRLTMIRFLHGILDGPDATLRTRLKDFVDYLGLECEQRSLPRDPLLPLSLVAKSA